MKLLQKPPLWLVWFILFIGIFTISTSSTFVRLAIREVGGINQIGFSLFLASSRLTLAALFLLPNWSKFRSQNLSLKAINYGIAAGFCLGIHFAFWIVSLSYTSIAASTTIVTTNPVWVALISWFCWGEKPKKRTILGISIALFGGLIVGLADLNASNAGSNPLLGDFLALLGSWAISGYLLLGREAQKNGIGIGSYITVVYSVAALFLLPLPLMFGATYLGYPNLVYFYIFLTTIFPQLIGHTSFNWALRRISPTLVTLAILFEPIFASIFGYLFFAEIPSLNVLIGAFILLCGVFIAAIKS